MVVYLLENKKFIDNFCKPSCSLKHMVVLRLNMTIVMARDIFMDTKDQIHPREKKDRAVIDNLLQGEPNDYNLLELARMTIRYRDFPGAREIQTDLATVLNKWQLTEEQLYQKTREIYAVKNPYSDRFKSNQKQDWT